jgi:hypothetical protein
LSIVLNDNNALVCPSCGCDKLHHVGIVSEDSPAVMAVQVVNSMVTQSFCDPRENPSARPSGIAIGFECEQYPAVSELRLAQHKGETIADWRIVATDPHVTGVGHA